MSSGILFKFVAHFMKPNVTLIQKQQQTYQLQLLESTTTTTSRSRNISDQKANQQSNKSQTSFTSIKLAII